MHILVCIRSDPVELFRHLLLRYTLGGFPDPADFPTRKRVLIDNDVVMQRKYQALWATGLAAILVLQFLFLTPFTLYAGNLEEFATSLPNILKHYAPLGLPLIAALALVGAAS